MSPQPLAEWVAREQRLELVNQLRRRPGLQIRLDPCFDRPLPHLGESLGFDLHRARQR